LKELGLQVDDKSQYKADGIIKLFKMKEIEVLFLETSGFFGNKGKVKINFDHHKGTFGSLAILKTIEKKKKKKKKPSILFYFYYILI
jgi:hypothetical protein